jgi:tRNA (guanine-N7-)-methyltransferase
MSVRRGPRLSLEELAPYLLSVPDNSSGSAPLDWAAVFGNDHPVELEVGFGKGLFLIGAAQTCPGVNFAGVEIVRKYQLFTATRLAKRGLRNVRVACADARRFLASWVASGSLQAVHVYFPDPWWKKRHHKRRVFTAEFVRACVGVLRIGGQLHAATDVEEYAGLMRELLGAEPALRPLPVPEPNQPSHDLDYLTNFERKFRQQGKPIYRLRYERLGRVQE